MRKVEPKNRLFNRRLTELRAQERAAKCFINAMNENSKNVKLIEFLCKNSKISKSRHFTDLVALYFLGKKRRFLEIGAAHPMHCSDTYLLENDFFWTGVQIEPNPELFRKLKTLRSSEVINAALVGNAKKKVPLFLNTENGTLSERRGVRVPAVTIGEVLEKFGSDFQACFIDIEGGEPDILLDELWGAIPFDFVSVERIWNAALIMRRLEDLGFVNILPEFSGYESWWVSQKIVLRKIQSLTYVGNDLLLEVI